MAYIASDGSIKQGSPKRSCNPLAWVRDAFSEFSPRQRAAALAAVAVAFRLWGPQSNPLAGGAVPAAARSPHEHWAFISKDVFFMRSMSEGLVAANKRKNQAALDAKYKDALIKKGGEVDLTEMVLGRVDFGGLDGHVAEGGDWGDIETMRGTRCSTTQSAVTAYFCGASVAGNQDAILGNEGKGYHRGVKLFANFISCRHRQGEENGRHRRSVYRLNVGCEDSLAGYSHAFSIVAQPDGSFFWLQSFISRYSLATWMGKTDDNSGSPRGHLSLADLLAKLKQLDGLMRINGWDFRANADYRELFDVDKELEATTKGKPPVSSTWKLTHRLSNFYWDEACEYPLPPHDPNKESEDANSHFDATTDDVNGNGFNLHLDDCVADALLGDLEHIMGKTRADDLFGEGIN